MSQEHKKPSIAEKSINVISSALSGMFSADRQDAKPEGSDRMSAEIKSQTQAAVKTCQSILAGIERVVHGKPLQVRQALTCLLAHGHLLIEDVPGVGKTTLAHALANTLGLQFNRVQFTSDLMPAEVVGGSVYDRDKQKFTFHPGPIFTEILLADEINRASPKTQSALLEAMAEGQVSVEGQTHKLPEPFFVIATQNPSHQMGTFPLPESQMDRFLMSLSMGYPDELSEKRMLMSGRHKTGGQVSQAAVDRLGVVEIQNLVGHILVSEVVSDYAYRVIRATREDPRFVDGLSPRAGMSWVRAAQAWALIDGRTWIIPDDLQAVFVQCAVHRLQDRSSASKSREAACNQLTDWLKKIPIEASSIGK